MPWNIAVANSEVLAIHAALLPTNEILYFGGDEHQHGSARCWQHRPYADLSLKRQCDPADGVTYNQRLLQWARAACR